jgi:hypothetical protein
MGDGKWRRVYIEPFQPNARLSLPNQQAENTAPEATFIKTRRFQ